MAKKEVCDVAYLKRKGHCIRPVKGTVEPKVLEAARKLLEDPAGFVVLDFISPAGANLYLRRLRKMPGFSDLGLGTKGKYPALFIHGCNVVGDPARTFFVLPFLRQSAVWNVIQPILAQAQLTDGWLNVLRMRYQEGHSMDEVAKKLGITRPRVGQILNSALGSLGLEPRWRLE